MPCRSVRDFGGAAHSAIPARSCGGGGRHACPCQPCHPTARLTSADQGCHRSFPTPCSATSQMLLGRKGSHTSQHPTRPTLAFLLDIPARHVIFIRGPERWAWQARQSKEGTARRAASHRTCNSPTMFPRHCPPDPSIHCFSHHHRPCGGAQNLHPLPNPSPEFCSSLSVPQSHGLGNLLPDLWWPFDAHLDLGQLISMHCGWGDEGDGMAWLLAPPRGWERSS